jgi:hypothetical protein
VALQIPNTQKTDHIALSSCEIIQEIFGLGANSFLRENDEDLLQRILGKYRRHLTARGNPKPSYDQTEDENMEVLIRRTLFLRRMELAIGTGVKVPRKQSLISTNVRSMTGTTHKGADSVEGNRKIRPA